MLEWLMSLASSAGLERPTPGLLLTALLLFVALVVVALCLVRVVLLLLRPVLHALDWLRVHAHRAAHTRWSTRWPRTVALLKREAAELLLLAAAGAVLIGCGGLLVWLGLAVVAQAPLLRIDQAVFAGLQAWRTDGLDTVMVAITEFGGARISVAVGVAVFAWLAWRRAWAPAIYWAVALIGARLCVLALKTGIERARPASIYGGVESFSFPSGHATSSMVTYGFLAFLLCIGQRWRIRIPVLTLAITSVVAIGLSRLYLGMHWLSDVLAGYMLGMVWILLLASLYLALHAPRRLPALRLAGVAGAVALAMGTWIAVYRLPASVERYREAAAAAPLPAVPRAGAATPAQALVASLPRAGAIPAAGRSCGGRCPALQSDIPPSRYIRTSWECA
ncbi:undecaprenyl-diphosphatase [Cupriavidus gilardii J11]|uniref:Undecaprenyl-diphosphatase n=1 Tax=Cupriavidus gilardii J11 TaxID=936133 RepID=A0A562BBW0_9BURK|nr:undecaprenyl-diphosphatase [Cupriavidus gilardii J11]